MEIQNQTDSFGALISGIDISSNLNEKQISEIFSAINKPVLVVPYKTTSMEELESKKSSNLASEDSSPTLTA